MIITEDCIFYQSVFESHRYLGVDLILTDFYVFTVLSDKEKNWCLHDRNLQMLEAY